MPRSEAHNDAPGDLRRTRLAGFSDSVVGVRFVDGVALDPMPPRVIERLRGIGFPVEDLGPWAVAADVLDAIGIAAVTGAAEAVAEVLDLAADAPPPAASSAADALADPGPRAPTARAPRTPRRRLSS